MTSESQLRASKKYRQTHKQKVSDLTNKWQKNNREKCNEYLRKRYINEPSMRIKNDVRRLTKRKLIKYGHILEEEVCEVKGCSEHGVIHHWDYNNPLDFTFLCKKHHLAVHRGEDVDCLRHF
jgi:hypothetical protein